MGKIFDALEKANKTVPISKTISRSPANKSNNTRKQMVRNVVKLEAVNKSGVVNKLDARLITYHSPQSVEAELFKVLRTNILFPSNEKPPRLILVTSALPGDGKSFVSSNLAISIAQGIEEHVLLIDGDIRKPSIQKLFGYEQALGLSEYLSNGTFLSDILLKTVVPKLTILPSGQVPPNPAELLSSKKMRDLLDEVKNRYQDRYIIIDSPPPSVATETSAIAKIAEGIIVVVKAGKTPRQAVTDVIEQVGKEKILGVVLNSADHSVNKYSGYGKPYYKAT